MPTLAAGQTRQTRTSVNVNSEVAQQYLASLHPTDLEDVPALELLHTLLIDVSATSAAALTDVVDVDRLRNSVYRDAAGTLVVHRPDHAEPHLALLWPVAQHAEHHKECTTITGAHGDVFVVNNESGDVLPLPAVAPGRCAFGWGSAEAEAVNLYLAIVYSVVGVHAPVPRPRHRDHPCSFYGWLVRRNCDRDLHLGWMDAVRMVRADEPLRQVAAQAAHRTTSGPSSAAPTGAPVGTPLTGIAPPVGSTQFGPSFLGSANLGPTAPGTAAPRFGQARPVHTAARLY